MNDGSGLVGIGYRANIFGITELYEDGFISSTIVSALYVKGDIARESYSLWLNSETNGSSSIIFGGVDTTKYTGNLVALPVLTPFKGISNYSAFYVAITGVSIKYNSGIRLLTDPDFATPAVLDSGTTDQLLPSDIYNSINDDFGVVEGLVPCAYRNANASLIYQFGGSSGPSIKVPLSALIDQTPLN